MSDNPVPYTVVPVNMTGKGPCFGIQDILEKAKEDPTKKISSLVMSEAELGRPDSLAAHTKLRDLIRYMYSKKPEQLLAAMGALPAEDRKTVMSLRQLGDRKNRQTLPPKRLPPYSIRRTEELCSLAANVMGGAALRAVHRWCLPVNGKPHIVAPLPLICPHSDKLVPVVREAPLPCSLPSVDLGRCIMRHEVGILLKNLDPNQEVFQPKTVKLHKSYYPGDEELQEMSEALRNFYTKLRNYIPPGGATLSGVFEAPSREMLESNWQKAAEIVAAALFKGIANRITGKSSFLMIYPECKKKLVDAGLTDNKWNTPDMIPSPDEAGHFVNLVRASQKSGKDTEHS